MFMRVLRRTLGLCFPLFNFYFSSSFLTGQKTWQSSQSGAELNHLAGDLPSQLRPAPVYENPIWSVEA
jgi:hypothetical protein